MQIPGQHNLQILRGLTTNRCLLSCTGDGKTVDLWSNDDGSGRQRWTFVLSKVRGEQEVYNIVVEKGLTSDRKFLSCSSDGARVDLWSVDDGSGRQRWEIFPIDNSPTPDTYMIKVCEGVASDRRYLSCTPDGKKVDLFPGDDGSGRQRWQIQGVWKA